MTNIKGTAQSDHSTGDHFTGLRSLLGPRLRLLLCLFESQRPGHTLCFLQRHSGQRTSCSCKKHPLSCHWLLIPVDQNILAYLFILVNIKRGCFNCIYIYIYIFLIYIFIICAALWSTEVM